MAACSPVFSPGFEFPLTIELNTIIDKIHKKIESKKFPEAKNLFLNNIKKFPPNNKRVKDCYNHLIFKLIKDDHNYSLAAKLYSIGRNSGLEINEATFLKLVHACGQEKDHNLYQNLFTDFSNRRIEPNINIYNKLFHLSKTWSESHLVYDLYEKMKSDGIAPNDTTLRVCWISAKENFKAEIDPETSKKCHAFFLNRTPVDFSPRSPLEQSRIQEIQSKRMQGSNTLKADPTAIKCWQVADEMVRSAANDPKHKPTLAWICEINRLLGQKGGGRLRQEGDAGVAAGGRTDFLYAPSGRVKEEMEQLVGWLNFALKQCKKGELNPIETAGKAYQRIVSIHPFHDQNGRTSRMVMDYVLQKFKLPPAAMGDDILVAFFSFRDSGQNPTTATEAVLKGVQHSYEILYPTR